MKKKIEMSESDGDDDAPESISFQAGKQENVEQSQKISEQVILKQRKSNFIQFLKWMILEF